MLIRWLLAAIHLLAFGFALASFSGVRVRCASLPCERAALRVSRGYQVGPFRTGVGRHRGDAGIRRFRKGADYYLHEPLFHVKMTLLVLILFIEIPSMIALIRWRASIRKGVVPNLKKARSYARYSVIQTVLLVLMVFAATGMARGIGLPAGVV